VDSALLVGGVALVLGLQVAVHVRISGMPKRIAAAKLLGEGDVARRTRGDAGLGSGTYQRGGRSQGGHSDREDRPST